MNNVMTPIVEIATMPEVSELKAMPSCTSQPIKLAAFERRRWLYLLTMPISWLLTAHVRLKKALYKKMGWTGPKINTIWFDGLGRSNRAIKEGSTSWRALDIIYNHRFDRSFLRLVDNFWIGMMNAQAVRNRFKLAKQEIRRAILRFCNDREVRIISLACGSAQAVIEVIAELKTREIRTKVLLVDINQDALDYARELAKRFGVSDQVELRKTGAFYISKLARDFRPHVIEMLGLLDYIPQEKAIRLVVKIREALEPGGIFLTCNIAPNIEQYFLKYVINWQMIYRLPAELAEISEKAGFSDYRIVYEPLKIHILLVSYKK